MSHITSEDFLDWVQGHYPSAFPNPDRDEAFLLPLSEVVLLSIRRSLSVLYLSFKSALTGREMGFRPDVYLMEVDGGERWGMLWGVGVDSIIDFYEKNRKEIDQKARVPHEKYAQTIIRRIENLRDAPPVVQLYQKFVQGGGFLTPDQEDFISEYEGEDPRISGVLVAKSRIVPQIEALLKDESLSADHSFLTVALGNIRLGQTLSRSQIERLNRCFVESGFSHLV